MEIHSSVISWVESVGKRPDVVPRSKSMISRPAVHSWNAAGGFMAERASMGESTDIYGLTSRPKSAPLALQYSDRDIAPAMTRRRPAVTRGTTR